VFAGALPLVEDGKPRAVIVIPAEPFPVAEHAAKELAYHVEKASGAKLEIRREPTTGAVPGPALYVGATRAAREAGIDAGKLIREAATLKTVGDVLYIVGNDGPGDPLSVSNSHSGTLFGVYEVLERHLGVRWLWPGALGESIPAARDIGLPAMDETFRPPFNRRHLSPGLGPKGFATAKEALAFSPENRERYARDQNLFLRRHRMGQAEDCYFAQKSFGGGHSFGGWWERYGKDHPEWFQLLPNGRRGPADLSRPNRYTMCVSNRGLQAEIVRRWREERARHPGEPVNIGAAENDDSAACTCAECKAWDGPPPDVSKLPPGLERSYRPMQASNRYARFAEAVRELAAETDPDVRVQYYAFLNYFWAPDPSIKLHRNLVIGFVPWFRGAGWFPRAEAEHEWIKSQWVGWQKSGVTLYYRPNWFLDGYTMPLVYMHQFADAFQFYARHGMTATDFDTLQGQWAAQGPNLYLLARIHVRPEAKVDDLLDEYYRGFGPAARTVKEYWDYWESYAVKNSPRAVESIRSRRGGNFRRYALYALVADELYPAECFGPAKTILDRALEQTTSGDVAQYRQRVEFLRDGLRHAEQCSATAAVVNDKGSSLADKRAAIARMAEVRRSLQHTNIANMDRDAIIETDSWKDIDGLFDP
jgi:hypothetical protein